MIHLMIVIQTKGNAVIVQNQLLNLTTEFLISGCTMVIIHHSISYQWLHHGHYTQ